MIGHDVASAAHGRRGTEWGFMAMLHLNEERGLR